MFLLQAADQGQDLLLHRHVERGDRLVGDNKGGAAHDRARDGDALPLPARKLMREAVRVHGIEPDFDQRFANPRRARGCVDVRHQAQRLGD